MQIVEPYAKIVIPPWGHPMDEYGVNLLRFVEWCARISHRSEEAQTEDSWRRFLETVVLGHGDWSVTEHAVVTVDAYVDRGITHEWVRHRIAAYTQESTRFVNYLKKLLPSFIYPRPADERRHPAWDRAIEACEEAYQELLEDGWTPQEARSVFPTGLAARLVATKNLRGWRHFFLMRTSKEAHPQMRQVTIPLLEEFKKTIPLLYDDIEPGQRQVDNMRKAR